MKSLLICRKGRNSLKNIPIPSQDAYLRNLIEKVENVLKRMRWKAHFFLKGDKISDQNNPFGLPSNKTPPTILEMKPFKSRVVIGSCLIDDSASLSNC